MRPVDPGKRVRSFPVTVDKLLVSVQLATRDDMVRAKRPGNVHESNAFL